MRRCCSEAHRGTKHRDAERRETAAAGSDLQRSEWKRVQPLNLRAHSQRTNALGPPRDSAEIVAKKTSKQKKKQCGVIMEKLPQDETSSPAPPRAAASLYSEFPHGRRVRTAESGCLIKMNVRFWLLATVKTSEMQLGFFSFLTAGEVWWTKCLQERERESMDHLLCPMLNEKALLRMSKLLPKRKSSETFFFFFSIFFCL